ncbi:MAG: SDR family oxidoreductase [Chloroflexi bacterium]|nr:SDR family oxidoreductase [Chloroflexota bacterium]
MDLGLTNRVAVVTGGSEGIGKAAAASMANEGANVAILARTQSKLDAAAEEIRATARGEVIAISCDASSRESVDAAFAEIIAKWGRVDIVVNNAGQGGPGGIADLTDEKLSGDFQLKVFGAVYCSQAALPHMQKARWGRIINVTTPGGKAAPGGTLPTSMSRAAGIAMTKAMSKELASDGILVNTVCIGTIKSGQHEKRWEAAHASDSSITLDDWYEKIGQPLPMGRPGEAHEAGDLICFLASEKASYITGTAVNMDGGSAPVV